MVTIHIGSQVATVRRTLKRKSGTVHVMDSLLRFEELWYSLIKSRVPDCMVKRDSTLRAGEVYVFIDYGDYRDRECEELVKKLRLQVVQMKGYWT